MEEVIRITALFKWVIKVILYHYYRKSISLGVREDNIEKKSSKPRPGFLNATI